MSDKKIFLDMAFLRGYLFTAAWVVLGAGILLTASGVVALGFLFMILGTVAALCGFSTRLLKIGYYPSNRLIMLALTGLLILMTSYSLRVFMLPPREISWLIYFIVTICFGLYTGFAFIRSAKKHPD